MILQTQAMEMTGSGNDKYKANKFDTIIDSDKKVAQIKV